MTFAPDPEFEDWKARAREADILQIAQALGAKIKRAGAVEWAGPCPACGGTDRFSINTRERVFNCRGARGGDVIGMVEHVNGCDFIAACEFVLNEPPPGRDRLEYRAPDPEILRERRDERRDADAAREREEAKNQADTLAKVLELFGSARTLKGTLGEDYFELRGIKMKPAHMEDIRFAPNLAYSGYADEQAGGLETLGRFHCIVSAVRSVAGDIIGVHRTYLDDSGPIKLRPPGDKKRNKAKKIFGRYAGGAIRLGEIGECLGVGEGLETTESFYALGLGPDDLTIACGVSLGNLAGAATGTIPHPTIKGRTIMNGVPDMARPGLILPPQVKRLILIGDGDSEPVETRMKLLTGARRFRAQGVDVSICMAPDGEDFNDVLRASLQ